MADEAHLFSVDETHTDFTFEGIENDVSSEQNTNANASRLRSFKGKEQEHTPNPDSELVLPFNRNPHPISITFREVLGRYGGGNKISNGGGLSSEDNDRKLSTEEIMRVAGERYLHFSNQNLDGITTFIHPYGSALSSLSAEEAGSTDLVHLLLSAAHKVSNRQFNSANRLLTQCESMSSESGNPVERISLCFSEALRERMSRETGSSTSRMESEELRGPNGLSTGVDLTVLATQNELPFPKVMQFASTQTILDNFAAATKIHIIDLHIRSGIHWTPFIQALSQRINHPVELLKITALDTKDKSKVEEIGSRLLSFAQSLSIPFQFKVVFVADMRALKEKHFDIKHGDSVAVYAPTILRTMISNPGTLENLMKVIAGLRPLIMILYEVEGSHNSPVFVTRFIEALFFYGAWFDCLEDCMDRDNPYRMKLERFYFGKGIVNTIATEGEERVTRSVRINVWRSFFERFRMVEVEPSKSSFEQANLILKQEFSCGSSCTLHKNGKCLIIGWKGTPMFSLSVWKFK